MQGIVIKPIRSTNTILRDLAESSADLRPAPDARQHRRAGRLSGYFNVFASKLESLVRS